jgi:predicted nucleic acid-binding Zn ribbon protein
MERAGRLVGKMNLLPQVADAETRARAAWPVAAGKKIAKHARATALVRGTLVVEVGDAIWQRQLATLRHFLLRNLARELGEGLVSEIDFRPTPARRPPQSAASGRPAPAHTDGIQDPVLALLYRRSQGNA